MRGHSFAAAEHRHQAIDDSRAAFLLLIAVLAACASGLAAGEAPAVPQKPPPAEPICISGIYPSLAALSDARTECGIGAVVPWAGSLWFITYPAHYGDGKLYQVDDLLRLHPRPESIGGTHAGRMIHRESNQLVIGPYFIDAKGKVRSCGVRARLTAVIRHLIDPENKVYYFDMEGDFVEADVHTLQYTKLFKLQSVGVTGTHGKGGYTGQGRVVIANNGGGGALAQWDGKAKAWTLLEHTQFCEVTGPGGIWGAPDDRSGDYPLWCTGWDRRSVILKVLDGGKWHTYRVPKSSYTHDAAHGWYTEWPRIRRIEPPPPGANGPGRLMMDFQGMFFDFPGGFSAAKTGGLRPIATHLRMVPDFCDWKGRVVLASDDTSVMGNPLGGQPQSNLWFGAPADLLKFGRPAGWGGPWLDDDVKAGVPSEPYLFDGFERRMVHITHDAPAEVEFTIEADLAGDGAWAKCAAVKVPPRGASAAAGGYAYYVFPEGFHASWVRLVSGRDCKATAYFHYTSRGGPARDAKPGEADGQKLFAALPAVGQPAERTDGVLLPHAGRLWFLAKAVDPDGTATDAGLYEIDQDMKLRRRPDLPASAFADKVKSLLAGSAPPKGQFASLPGGLAVGWDDASVIVKAGGAAKASKAGKNAKKGAVTYRLPKADAAYDRPPAAGWRLIREVVTERYLMNCHGLFYEVPREELWGLRPVAAHGKVISDYCTWRGLLVLAGALKSAKPDGHLFAADDSRGLWFGAVDDLWMLGKPRGTGGPWRKTPVQAGQPSDPYLMTGFDTKSVELSHDADTDVTFTIEVQFAPGGPWCRYQTVAVPPGPPAPPARKVRHEFPAGYSANWVRVTADKACKATAWFVYE